MLAREQNYDHDGDAESDSDKECRICMTGEQGKDVTSVGGPEIGEDGVADEASDGHGRQEFWERVLHSARCDHERN